MGGVDPKSGRYFFGGQSSGPVFTFTSYDPVTHAPVEFEPHGAPASAPASVTAWVNEIAALTKAFRAQTEKTNYCAVGSLKSNLGHLNTAAGVAGSWGRIST